MRQKSVKEFQLAGISIFFEDFKPSEPSLFDAELDEITKTYALESRLIKGFCNISTSQTDFSITDPNFRENVIAATSYSTNRQRSVVCGLSVALFEHPYATLPEIAGFINEHELKIYTAEANSPIFNALKQQIRPDLLAFSEYFGDQYQSGVLVKEIMHQDLQATSFEDNTFDLILTSDVLEHVPDAIKAEKEIIRILKPGGIYCFTVPFVPYEEHDILMAELDHQGNIIYFAEPQYHGDPMRPEGILVFRLFSYNGLKTRFEGLNCKFNSYRFWSKTLGILGNDAMVQLAVKKIEGSPNVGSDSSLAKNLSEVNIKAFLSEHIQYIQTLNNEKISLILQLDQLQKWALSLEKQVLSIQASNKPIRLFTTLRKLFKIR